MVREMKNKIFWMFFVISVAIKFLISLIISDPITSFVYCLFLLVNYLFLMSKKSAVSLYLPLVMSDFIFGFYLCFNIYGMSIYSLIFSLIYFVCSGAYMYFLVIDYLAETTSNKALSKISNLEIDKGIKALENDDYNLAIEAFSNAIKEHKKNYLGYMGMCNTLTKMDEKSLKKIKYYKKKCIKYAPKELKESIVDKF